MSPVSHMCVRCRWSQVLSDEPICARCDYDRAREQEQLTINIAYYENRYHTSFRRSDESADPTDVPNGKSEFPAASEKDSSILLTADEYEVIFDEEPDTERTFIVHSESISDLIDDTTDIPGPAGHVAECDRDTLPCIYSR